MSLRALYLRLIIYHKEGLAMKHPGFMEVDMGQKVGRYPIDKIKFSSSKRELLTFLSPKPMVTKTHYHEDLGNFYYSDTAVEHGLDIKVKYNFIAVRWNTDTKGRLQDKENWELVLVSLSTKDYESLAFKAEMNGALSKHMIMVICENEQYQNVMLEVAGAAPSVSDKALATAVKAEYQRVKPFVPQVIAQVHSEKKVAEALGPVQGSADFQRLEARQQASLGAGEPEALMLGDGEDADFDMGDEDETPAPPKKASKKRVKEEVEDAEFDEDDEDSDDEDSDDEDFDFDDDEDFD